MPDVTEDAKYRVIELLAENPDMTREMARRLDLTLGKLLAESVCGAGLVKTERFAESDKKMGYWYVLTPAGVADE